MNYIASHFNTSFSFFVKLILDVKRGNNLNDKIIIDNNIIYTNKYV